jgi:hypothetical protein
MALKVLSNKRFQIDKANATIVVVTAISSFIVIFSLVASNALLSQRNYQSRVIAKKEKARNALKQNIATSKALINSYKAFIGTAQNVIGGNPNGQGNRDGNNAQITLDALPSSYDFPAVTSSLENILTQNGVTIQSITGTDNELSQIAPKKNTKVQPIPIPFNISVIGQYQSIQNLISIFESSIRPFSIISINLSGTDAALNANIKAQTYYQPETTLNISSEVVK